VSRYSFLTLFIVAFLLISCEQPRPKQIYEDLNYMSAVDRFENRDYAGAMEYYEALYKDTKNLKYYFGVLDSLFALKKYNEVELKSKEYLLKNKNSKMLRYLILALYKQKKDEEAIDYGEKLIKDEKKIEYKDYIILADLYLKTQKYNKSLFNYEKAYELEKNSALVDKISFLMFEKLNRQKEAISYLETHIRMNECDLYLCGQLANYYLKVGDIESIIEIYKKIYKKTDDTLIGKKIVELYILRKNYDDLAIFLEETGLDNNMLFEIYKINKDYKKMATVSKRLYEESMDVKYLAQNAMFEFEYAKKKDKKLIRSTVDKLEEVVKSNKSPLYLNYLGYLLIDYNINIKKGIKYVKMALQQDEDNIYYKDSLAWGEYKLKNYQEAYNIMKSVNKVSSDKTVKEHFKIIKKSCKKSKKCKVN
jgi:tetratricopeptide (TPR) repeat protein